MLAPSGKKPGRNDRCWCGSGKKYKQCHLKQDQEEARAAAAQAASFAPPPLPPPPRPTFTPPLRPELSPEEAEAEAVFDRFEDADLEGKIAIFLESVDQQWLTGDDAFEMLDAIREASHPAEDPIARDQFRRLAERLEVTRPEVYEEEAGFLLESLIQDAAAEEDWTRVAELLQGLAEDVETHAEEFARVAALLLYYDQRQMLLPVLQESWPVIAESDELTDWGIEEFALTLLDANLFDYLETTSQPQPDDPALIGRFPPDMLPLNDVFRAVVPRFAVPGPSLWRRADFDETVDVETWQSNAALLLWDFIAERRRAAGTPYTRSNMARILLLEMLQHQATQLAPAKSKQKKGKGKEPAPSAYRPLSLIPDRDTLEARVRLSSPFDDIEPYAAAALMELLPAYLHYLARLGLIHPVEMDAALAELSASVEPGMTHIRAFGGDPRAIDIARAAWSDAALDALRDDPALAEARAQAPVIRQPVADPMANAPVYRFKVTYQLADDVWFVIDMPRDRTLHDLHRAILGASDFDEDHLYSFFLSGRAWDDDTEYNDHDGRFSSQTPIGRVPLRLKQRFLYLYDYGDQHMFTVQLLGPSPEPGDVRSSRLMEVHGTMPPQYGTFEDEDWEEADDEWEEEEEDEWEDEPDADEEDD